jgi:hypothetical protein
MAAAQISWPGAPDYAAFNAAIADVEPDGIRAVALEVAENLALRAMSRMCRKGMGYTRWDDPRLKDAEYMIDQEEEIGRLADALGRFESAERHKHGQVSLAGLWAFYEALAQAWRHWEERPGHFDDGGYNAPGARPRHAILEKVWHGEYGEASCFGLTDTLAAIFFREIPLAIANMPMMEMQFLIRSGKWKGAIPPMFEQKALPMMEMLSKFPDLMRKARSWIKQNDPAIQSSSLSAPEGLVLVMTDLLVELEDEWKQAKVAAQVEEQEAEAAKQEAAGNAIAALHMKARINGLNPGASCCWKCCLPIKHSPPDSEDWITEDMTEDDIQSIREIKREEKADWEDPMIQHRFNKYGPNGDNYDTGMAFQGACRECYLEERQAMGLPEDSSMDEMYYE